MITLLAISDFDFEKPIYPINIDCYNMVIPKSTLNTKDAIKELP